MREEKDFVVRQETIDYEAKIRALERELDKAHKLVTWIRKELHMHGAYQVGMATGVVKGLGDAIHIMRSPDRAKK